MHRNAFVRTGVTVLLVCVVGAFFYSYLNDAHPGRENGGEGTLETSDGQKDETTETGETDQAQDKKNNQHLRDTEVQLNDTSDLARSAADLDNVTEQKISEMLNYEASVVGTYKQLAVDRKLSYEAAMKNVALWDTICSVADEKIHDIYGERRESDGSNSIIGNVSELCEDFSRDIQGEINDLLDAEIITPSEETWMTEVRSTLDDFGRDAAFDRAIDQLSRSLDRYNYALSLDTVWFLGISFTMQNDPRSEFDYSYLSSDVEVIFSVTAQLFCERLGGCNGQHPVTLQLCLQFNDRRCTNPVSITGAIDQILTGSEHQEFLKMHFGLRNAIILHQKN